VLRFLVNEVGVDVNQELWIHTSSRDFGSTPLNVAAYRGNIDVVKCLLYELDVKVNQRTQNGATPLLIAAANVHLDVLRFLANEAGADVNQGADDGSTSPCTSLQRMATWI
jgi:ankyrin repeat protein